MRVEFIKKCLTIYGICKKGDVLEVDDTVASDWIAQGLVKEPVPKTERPAVEAQQYSKESE